MNRELQTSCSGCIFKSDSGCELGKLVLFEKQGQVTPGFCGHKRMQSWVTKNSENPDFSKENIMDFVEGEYQAASVVILALENDFEAVKETIESMGNNGLVKEIIVVTGKLSEGHLEEWIHYLTSVADEWKSDLAWGLRSLEEHTHKKYQNAVFSLVNDIAQDVEEMWFVTVMAGQRILGDMLDSIAQQLEDKYISPLAFYINKDDVLNIFAPKTAFLVMDGHNDKPWFEKVQEFSNWKSVCGEIQYDDRHSHM